MTQIKMRPRELGKLREAVGYGLLNLGHELETRSKANAPVRGGHRSFNPDQPTGGHLRRGIHAVAYVDGRPINGVVDDNGQAVDYTPRHQIELVLASDADYSVYVHEGTSRMPARPYMTEALLETQGHAGALVEAGARRRLGQ